MWGFATADEELGYVYLPLSTPTNDWYGGHRAGNNLFAETLVCVDAATGKRIWHFQITHHGVWDYDLNAAPILANITVGGKEIKAVIQLTKQAMAFVFDRVTGEPVWPIEERPVPQSNTPGERLSPTQPFPTKPAPYDRQGISVDDLIDFTPALRAEALDIAKQYVLGPIYTPPSIAGTAPGETKGTIAVPGWMGGSNWNGGAFDPETGVLYVPSWTAPDGYRLREAKPDESDMRYLGSRGYVRGPQGLPLLKPPYGRITAINMNTGEHLWMIPNGEGPRNHPLLKDLNLPRLGNPGRPHPLLTRTLLFIGEGNGEGVLGSTPPGMEGNMFRAYDKRNGSVLWETRLSGSTSAGAPMTYAVNGRQYVVIPVGGRGNNPGELVAFGLGDGASTTSASR
jgi:quinoprotein glucose dehydrogenase